MDDGQSNPVAMDIATPTLDPPVAMDIPTSTMDIATPTVDIPTPTVDPPVAMDTGRNSTEVSTMDPVSTEMHQNTMASEIDGIVKVVDENTIKAPTMTSVITTAMSQNTMEVPEINPVATDVGLSTIEALAMNPVAKVMDQTSMEIPRINPVAKVMEQTSMEIPRINSLAKEPAGKASEVPATDKIVASEIAGNNSETRRSSEEVPSSSSAAAANLNEDPLSNYTSSPNSPFLGCCANCSVRFEDEESKIENVHSQAEGDISIQTALGHIFEMRMDDEIPLGEGLFNSRTGRISFCETCSASLNSLYDALKQFRMLCAFESLVFKQLQFISKVIQKKVKSRNKRIQRIEPMEDEFPLKVKLEVEDDDENDVDYDADNFIDDSTGYAHDPGQVSDYDDSDNSQDEENEIEEGIGRKRALPQRQSAQKFHSTLSQIIDDEESSEDSTYYDDHDFDPNSDNEEPEDDDEIHPKLENESYEDSDDSNQFEKFVPIKVKRKRGRPKSTGSVKHTPVKIKKEEVGAFPCSQCPKSFLNAVNLRRHERTHDPEVQAKLTCSHCLKIFSRGEHLTRHLRKVHGEQKKVDQELPVSDYKCPVCSVDIECSYQAFEEHVNTHGVENPFTCSHCPEVFPSLKKHKHHMSKIHKEIRPTCICQVCNAQFVKYYHLSRHQRNKHRVPNNMSIESQEIFDLLQPDFRSGGRNSGSHSCAVCLKVYSRKDKLTKHMLSHTAEAPFTCAICGKKFFSERGLENHKIVHSEDNPNKCEVCKKVLSRPDHLKAHMLTHEKEPKVKPERVFSCEVCGKEFKNNDNLKMHRYCHTNERPWSCEICGKTFNHPSSLALHMKVHSDERPFCCSVCGRTFKLGHHLRDHELTHSDNAPRPFTCETCGKAFKKLKHVKSHMKVHEGRKDHVCDECGKAFTQIYNLRAHIRGVHMNDPSVKRKKKEKTDRPFIPPPPMLPQLPQLPPPPTIQGIPHYQHPNQMSNEPKPEAFAALPPHSLFPYRPHMMDLNY